MTAKASVRPIRVYIPDEDLATVRAHGVGFRATCECGQTSPRCGSYAMARGWLREHRRGCRGRNGER